MCPHIMSPLSSISTALDISPLAMITDARVKAALSYFSNLSKMWFGQKRLGLIGKSKGKNTSTYMFCTHLYRHVPISAGDPFITQKTWIRRLPLPVLPLTLIKMHAEQKLSII